MDAMERTEKNDFSTEDDEDLPIPELPKLTPEHLRIKRRLGPLVQVESALVGQLSPLPKQKEGKKFEATGKTSLKEVAVNSATQWKDCFRCFANSGRFSPEGHVDWDDSNDPGRVLHACSEDMVRLWNDPIIQELLKKLKIRMEDHAGLYVPVPLSWVL